MPARVSSAADLPPSGATSERAAWLSPLALGTVYVVWGSTYFAIRVMVETFPALLSAGLRFAIAGAVLYLWLRVRRGRAAVHVDRREAAGAALVGLLLSAGGNGLVTVAERHTASSLAALVIASTPLIIVVIRALLGEHVGRGALLGVAVGFAGVAILLLPSHHTSGTGLVGVLLVLAAAVSWAAGSVTSTRLRLPRDPLVSTALQMAAGGAAMLVAGALTGEAGKVDLAQLSLRSSLAFLYLIVFGSLVAFSAYSWLLQHVPISKVSTYAYVNPVIAVFLGWAFLSESISATTLLGAAVIVSAVWFILRATRRAAGATIDAPADTAVASASRRG